MRQSVMILTATDLYGHKVILHCTYVCARACINITVEANFGLQIGRRGCKAM